MRNFTVIDCNERGRNPLKIGPGGFIIRNEQEYGTLSAIANRFEVKQQDLIERYIGEVHNILLGTDQIGQTRRLYPVEAMRKLAEAIKNREKIGEQLETEI
jgi:hypothetical protein